MKKNIGTADKIVRFIIAVVLLVLYLTNVVSGTWGIILLIFAAMLVLTSIFGICGLYSILGISTCKISKKS